MRKLSIITLGVSNLQRSIRFYKIALELMQVPYESDSIAFFDLYGPGHAPYSKVALAEDAGISPEGQGFSGITLAQNAGSSAEVTELRQRAVNVGGTLVKSGQPVFWGGFSGYFADPGGPH